METLLAILLMILTAVVLIWSDFKVAIRRPPRTKTLKEDLTE
ncbi:hypothetical protein [Furfurilactobacillus curtus]|uniref:Uncharacterized protein n=1 Tax=Furfurilactobacillus curtus TaxID=1746200 RepID=A0ABQ5JSJ2_9LACO